MTILTAIVAVRTNTMALSTASTVFRQAGIYRHLHASRRFRLAPRSMEHLIPLILPLANTPDAEPQRISSASAQNRRAQADPKIMDTKNVNESSTGGTPNTNEKPGLFTRICIAVCFGSVGLGLGKLHRDAYPGFMNIS